MASSLSYDIRPISDEEFDAFAAIPQHAFSTSADPDETALERSMLELDRTLAAIDTSANESGIVASATAFSYQMTVPGGSVPAAGVSWVAVLSSHRRRRILSALMRRQLDDVHAAGREPVAILWASEAPIYGRFGYGLASSGINFTVPRSANAMRAIPGTDDLRVRLVEPTESVDLVEPVYNHDRARRPGMLARSEPWARAAIFVYSSERGGSSPLRTAIVDGPDGVRGYARYVTTKAWSDGIPHGTTAVRELHAVDPAAAWVLWRHVTDLDLSGETKTNQRPVDDPLLSFLENPRAARSLWSDGLYVRLVDVGAALSQRSYAGPTDVVLDVVDDFCTWNTGRWHLSGDATGGRCERTQATADVRLTARDLGATYLGGTSLRALADAGLVEESTAGAVGELSRALWHDPAPWSSFIF